MGMSGILEENDHEYVYFQGDLIHNMLKNDENKQLYKLNKYQINLNKCSALKYWQHQEKRGTLYLEKAENAYIIGQKWKRLLMMKD